MMVVRGSLVGLMCSLGALLVAGAAPAAAQNPFENGQVTIVNVGQGSGEIHFRDPLFVQTTNCFSLDPGESCVQRFVVAPFLTMGISAYPASGSFVADWSLPCDAPPYGETSLLPECYFHLDALPGGELQKRIEVDFAREKGFVNVSKVGIGNGEVRSTPAGITCTGDADSDCTESFLEGTSVTLKAVARDDGSRFSGWSGACAGTGSCVVPIVGTVFSVGSSLIGTSVSVEAGFTRELRRDRPDPVPTRTLLVSTGGLGQGEVRSVPRTAGIGCGQDCRETVPLGRSVVLRAIAAPGSEFVRWGPECENATSLACRITMSANRRVSATFARTPRELRVVAQVGGVVTSAPAGISCAAATPVGCVGDFPENTSVVLAADPDDGFAFAGWSNACAGTAGCVARMDVDRVVTARFVPIRRLLVRREGAGAGTIVVRASGADTECSIGCAAYFPEGTVATVDAQPQQGSTLAGFSEACTGTGPCTITMDADKTVAVRFDVPPDTATLSIGFFGSGQGTVTSNPAGIDCRPDCFEPYALGTRVTLTAQPAQGSAFGRFAGPCATVQGATCTVQLDQSQQILAAFDRADRPVTPPLDPPDDPTDVPPPTGADVSVAARIAAVRTARSGARRVVRLTVAADERVVGTVRLSRRGQTLFDRVVSTGPGRRTVRLRVRRAAKAGRARLTLRLYDEAGNERTIRRVLRVPR